jgi:hypothetical protein
LYIDKYIFTDDYNINEGKIEIKVWFIKRW